MKCVISVVQICTLYAVADAIKFRLSTDINIWEQLQNSCIPFDASEICSSNDRRCSPDFLDSYDVSSLPQDFAVWIKAYLTKSASIVYQGCFKVTTTLLLYSRQVSTNDSLWCVRKCLSQGSSQYSYIGVSAFKCYCLAVPLSSISQAIHLPNQFSETACLDTSNERLKMYEIVPHVSTDIRFCPVAYHILSTTTVNVEDCEEENIFYCSGSPSIERKATTWKASVDFCRYNDSSSMAAQFEVQQDNKKFWLNGLLYNEYEINYQLPLFKTRCAALVRKNSQFMIEALNCSLLLPTLCQPERSGEPDTIYTAPTDINKTSVANISSFTTTKLKSTKLSTPTMKNETTPEGFITTTESVSVATLRPVIEPISIVVPLIGIILFLAIAVFVDYLRRRIQEKRERKMCTEELQAEAGEQLL